MRAFRSLLLVTILIMMNRMASSTPRAGFFLPDSVQEMTLQYRTLKDLILLPVVLNDSITVNLILDTGCRNLVLFGKRFESSMKLHARNQVKFSGLGEGRAVMGHLSIGNKVSIRAVLGQSIPVVVVPKKSVFTVPEADGVIGYEIFMKFEIELNPATQTITFRPALKANAPKGFANVPLRIVDSRPVMSSRISMGLQKHHCDIMIDTGSSLGLLLKTTDLRNFDESRSAETVIGYGLNGKIGGYEAKADHVQLQGFEMSNVPAGVIFSPWHNYGSVGMSILKDYILVINYCKAYACFKRITPSL